MGAGRTRWRRRRRLSCSRHSARMGGVSSATWSRTHSPCRWLSSRLVGAFRLVVDSMQIIWRERLRPLAMPRTCSELSWWRLGSAVAGKAWDRRSSREGLGAAVRESRGAAAMAMRGSGSRAGFCVSCDGISELLLAILDPRLVRGIDLSSKQRDRGWFKKQDTSSEQDILE